MMTRLSWFYKCSLSIVSVVLVLVSLQCTEKPTTPADEVPSSETRIRLTGTWTSSYGLMLLEQSGDSVTGQYIFRTGQLAGKLSHDTLHLIWWEGVQRGKPYSAAHLDNRGNGYFRISATQDTLLGDWRFEESPIWDSVWFAMRISDSLLRDTFAFIDTTTPVIPEDTTIHYKGLALDSESANAHLFSVYLDSGVIVHFCGVYSADSGMTITHCLIDGIGEETWAVLYTDLLAVHWMVEGGSAALQPVDTLPFDPQQAACVVVDSTGEHWAVLDIVPSKLEALCDSLSAMTEDPYENIRSFLSDYGAGGFDSLRVFARAETPADPSYTVAAAGLGAAASALAIRNARFTDSLSQKSRRLISTNLISGRIIRMASHLLKTAVKGQFGSYRLIPDAEHTIGVLLCQGGSKIPKVCLSIYYLRCEEILCAEKCKATMDCFTNICMPAYVSVETSMNFGGSLKHGKGQ